MEIIDSHHSSSVSPYDDISWPWTLKIYTLGRFSILLDGKPLRANGVGVSKPVELLKVLIALGGRDVSEFRLSEALWPDSEGDQAHSSFTTTLSRLRKLIGVKALVLMNGQLSLNDRYCWVDSWAFERFLGQLESYLMKSGDRPVSGIQSRVDQLFGLYHGLFLQQEAQAGWVLPLRERLRSKFLRSIRSLIQFYRDRGGECSSVVALYEKAREIDPCSEEYCRGLMRCRAAQGNRPEALALFESCKLILKETFGIKPSAKTTQLYHSIRNSRHDMAVEFCGLCARNPE